MTPNALRTIQQTVQIVELFCEDRRWVKNINKKLYNMYIIVHLKVQLEELSKDLHQVVQWKINEKKNIVLAVVHKKILI